MSGVRSIFKLKQLLGFLAGRAPFQLPYYREAELSRLMNLFAHVDLNAWRGMKILEVGAGPGRIGEVFEHLGFEVTSTDGRPEYVERMRKEGRDSFLLDLDDKGVQDIEGFDIILAFGILYHLSEPERFLRSCAEACRILLLESLVCDYTQPILLRTPEVACGWRSQDQALNGMGCRPSASWIENICRQSGFVDIRDVSNSIADWEIGTFDWQPTDKGVWMKGKQNLRRMWVMKKSKDA